MEVMRVVLLCALALLPQGFGKQTYKRRSFNYIETKPNSTILMQLNPFPPHKVLLNMPSPSYIPTSEMQTVFQDIKCQLCVECMERAIRAHKYQTKNSLRRSYADELQNELLTNQIGHRAKRYSNSNETTIGDIMLRKEKKTKTKRSKLHKAVTVTKFNIDGKITALKVRETGTPLDHLRTPIETCEVYSIKKSFPCDSPEGDLMVKLAKRKTNKKTKKQKESEKDAPLAPQIIEADKEKPQGVFRKREIDNSQMPESVISSVEEYF